MTLELRLAMARTALAWHARQTDDDGDDAAAETERQTVISFLRTIKYQRLVALRWVGEESQRKTGSWKGCEGPTSNRPLGE